MRVLASAAMAVLAASVLSACAASPGGAPTSPPDAGQTASAQTGQPATVLDDGDGPELCLGMMLASYPPQCGGPEIIGWDWSDWEGHFEEASGVRWGSFFVAGTYDAAADTFTVAEVEPEEEHDWGASDPGEDIDFSSPCAEPVGGWRVLDPEKTTWETQEQAIQIAETLEGYAGAWVDQSLNPLQEDDFDPEADPDAALEWELGVNDPIQLILNIRTTGDTAATETALREVWGGMLCVSTAVRSEAELNRIRDEIFADGTARILGGWADVTTGVVHVELVFDDGRLQRSLDEKYGEGVVEVGSALIAWP